MTTNQGVQRQIKRKRIKVKIYIKIGLPLMVSDLVYELIDRVVALPRHKFVTGATLLQL
jgi:hypothetical protein